MSPKIHMIAELQNIFATTTKIIDDLFAELH